MSGKECDRDVWRELGLWQFTVCLQWQERGAMTLLSLEAAWDDLSTDAFPGIQELLQMPLRS